MDFSAIIIAWYHQHKRDLPWRNTKNPYLIWLSEIILQQTRVEQGMPYYLRFRETFPTVKHLAKAGEEQVLKLWQGLGYYSRARNLHYTAKIVLKDYKGAFPREYEDVLKLKGIGEYTAAAIVSFAFNKPHPVVDGNVFRVLSRIFDLDTPIDSGQGKKEFYELANELLDKEKPAEFNQAIMEFGAMQCVPKNPNCNNCPFSRHCIAFNGGKIELLPVKAKKIKQRNRFLNYIVINQGDYTYLNKRTGNDIWKNLYDFPVIETKKAISESSLIQSKHWQDLFKERNYLIKAVSAEYKHVLTHQKIYARFLEIDLSPDPKKGFGNFKKISKSELSDYAIPKLIDNYLSNKSM